MVSEDARHVERSLLGEAEAYRALVDKYWSAIAVLAYQRIGDRDEAEDVAQETFLRAYRALPKLKEPAKFFRWTVRIARRVTLDRLRSRRRTRAQSYEELPTDLVQSGETESTSPEAILEAREEATRALRAMGRLPERYRMVLTLRYLLGHDPKEISNILGEPDGTIRNRIFRALDRLRRMLDHG